jgi:two-component system response regulator BaeR
MTMTAITPPTRLILLVEDDAKIADMVANYLHMHGFATHIEGDGAQALAWLHRTHGVPAAFPVLVLLDVMLPGLDGMAVCEAVRAFSAVPIIMLTARIDEVDRLLGLDIGADDYVCKPFSPRELVARVKALLRRSEGELAVAVSSPEFTLDDEGQRAFWQGQPLLLTPVEFRLFRLLLSRPSHVFARARLLDALHQDFRDVSDRAIDSHVKNLRRKIDQLRPLGSGIASVYGVGYRFDPESL